MYGLYKLASTSITVPRLKIHVDVLLHTFTHSLDNMVICYQLLD